MIVRTFIMDGVTACQYTLWFADAFTEPIDNRRFLNLRNGRGKILDQSESLHPSILEVTIQHEHIDQLEDLWPLTRYFAAHLAIAYRTKLEIQIFTYTDFGQTANTFGGCYKGYISKFDRNLLAIQPGYFVTHPSFAPIFGTAMHYTFEIFLLNHGWFNDFDDPNSAEWDII